MCKDCFFRLFLLGLWSSSRPDLHGSIHHGGTGGGGMGRLIWRGNGVNHSLLKTPKLLNQTLQLISELLSCAPVTSPWIWTDVVWQRVRKDNGESLKLVHCDLTGSRGGETRFWGEASIIHVIVSADISGFALQF